jgi:hypothetical protein
VNNIDIDYNTEQEEIRFPEYGRSIHQLLAHVKTIEDPRRRQRTMEYIIALMQHLNPMAGRHPDDYREKMWSHAFAIANYELDVVIPPGVTIRQAGEKTPPPVMEYPPTASRFRHYGNGVQALIRKAIEMPDGPKKEGFVEMIASYMKLAYKTWNKEHYVSDDVVKDDLEILSDGQLELHEGHSSLDTLAASAGRLDRDRGRNYQHRNRGKQGGNYRNQKRSQGGNGGGNYRKRKK